MIMENMKKVELCLILKKYIQQHYAFQNYSSMRTLCGKPHHSTSLDLSDALVDFSFHSYS